MVKVAAFDKTREAMTAPGFLRRENRMAGDLMRV